MYHFANLLMLLAAEFGDRVVFDEGRALHTNFYVFACGRTGTKKSTASDLVRDYVTKKLPDLMHSGLTSVSSAEGLIRTLTQRPNLFLRYDEIKDLFVTASRSGQRIEPILNQAFDHQALAAIVRNARNSLTATDYYFNLLLNGTQDHVRLDLSEAMFAGGLLNRFLVFGGEPTGVTKPRMGVPDTAATQEIADRVYALRNEWMTLAPTRASLRVGMSPEADAMHGAWYDAHTLRLQGLKDMDAKPLTRLDTHVKKLAMIYRMIEPPIVLHPMISPDQMAAALAVIAYCQASMIWMTRGWSGQKSMSQQSEALTQERVEAYLQVEGCTSERTMYRALHLSVGDCARSVNALVATGQVNVSGARPRMVHDADNCKCGAQP